MASSSSSKRARIRFYNPKPLSQAPPNSDPFKSCTPFISDEIFDERRPVLPGDPKRPPELPSNWIMEEHVRKGGKYIGRKYMIFIEPVNGEHFKSLKGVRQHLGLPTKSSKSKQQGDNPSPKSTKPDPRQFPSENLSNQEMKERAMSESQMMYPNALYTCQKDGDENQNSGLDSNPESNSNYVRISKSN